MNISDKVVRLNKKTKPLIWTVVGDSNVFKNSFVCDHEEMMIHHFHVNELRLATPQEIKAGHRL